MKEIKIPEGYTARIDGNKVILEPKESEDERIRKELVAYLKGEFAPGQELIKQWIAYLEKQKDASKAIETVDRIDKYIDEHVANAHDMKDSNPDKKYYSGWDDALGKMAGILQDIYSNEKQKEQKQSCDNLDDEIHRFFADCIDVHEAKLYGNTSERVIPVDCYEMTARHFAKWSEKQKEQKPLSTEETELNSIAFLEQLGYTCIPPGAEQKSAGWIGLTSKDAAINTLTHTAQSLKDHNLWPGLQSSLLALANDIKHMYVIKPAEWSDDDEIWAHLILRELEQDKEDSPEYSKHFARLIDWFTCRFKSLRPQPKQEWSDEDENRFRNLIYLVEHSNEGKGTKEGFVKFINKLKSLRPQPHWKPSEEQMDALFNASAAVYSEKEQKALESLYFDLKKL